jgi:hypothetical protein
VRLKISLLSWINFWVSQNIHRHRSICSHFVFEFDFQRADDKIKVNKQELKSGCEDHVEKWTDEQNCHSFANENGRNVHELRPANFSVITLKFGNVKKLSLIIESSLITYHHWIGVITINYRFDAKNEHTVKKHEEQMNEKKNQGHDQNHWKMTIIEKELIMIFF